MSHFDFMMTYVLLGHLIILIRPSLVHNNFSLLCVYELYYSCKELFFNSQFLCETDILFYFSYKLIFLQHGKETKRREIKKSFTRRRTGEREIHSFIIICVRFC